MDEQPAVGSAHVTFGQSSRVDTHAANHILQKTFHICLNLIQHSDLTNSHVMNTDRSGTQAGINKVVLMQYSCAVATFIK